jgi:hypothetical protein
MYKVVPSTFVKPGELPAPFPVLELRAPVINTACVEEVIANETLSI